MAEAKRVDASPSGKKGGYSPMTRAIIPGTTGRRFAPPIRGFVGAPLRPGTPIAYRPIAFV